MKSGLCRTCCMWVRCNPIKNSFCLAKDLYTHTDKPVDVCCMDYQQGDPITEKEYYNIGGI